MLSALGMVQETILPHASSAVPTPAPETGPEDTEIERERPVHDEAMPWSEEDERKVEADVASGLPLPSSAWEEEEEEEAAAHLTPRHGCITSPVNPIDVAHREWVESEDDNAERVGSRTFLAEHYPYQASMSDAEVLAELGNLLVTLALKEVQEEEEEEDHDEGLDSGEDAEEAVSNADEEGVVDSTMTTVATTSTTAPFAQDGKKDPPTHVVGRRLRHCPSPRPIASSSSPTASSDTPPASSCPQEEQKERQVSQPITTIFRQLLRPSCESSRPFPLSSQWEKEKEEGQRERRPSRESTSMRACGTTFFGMDNHRTLLSSFSSSREDGMGFDVQTTTVAERIYVAKKVLEAYSPEEWEVLYGLAK